MAQRHSSTDWGPQRLPEGLCWLWSACCVEPLSPTLGEDGLSLDLEVELQDFFHAAKLMGRWAIIRGIQRSVIHFLSNTLSSEDLLPTTESALAGSGAGPWSRVAFVLLLCVLRGEQALKVSCPAGVSCPLPLSSHFLFLPLSQAGQICPPARRGCSVLAPFFCGGED